MKRLTKQIADGILFQFLMVGSLSFSHIHDVVAAHGQSGWKAWMYPPSVDLLTVAAYRKILVARQNPDEHAGMAWFAFLLAMFASLTANVVDAWAAGASGLALAVGIGVWPPVALLVCTMLGHDSNPAEKPAPEAVREAVTRTAPEAPVATPAPLPAAPAPAASVPAQPASAPTPQSAPAPLPATKSPTASRPKAAPGTGRVRRTLPQRSLDELIDEVGKLEDESIAASGKGISYRAATAALGVRYADAKVAVDAMRARRVVIPAAPLPTIVIPAPAAPLAHANGSAATS